MWFLLYDELRLSWTSFHLILLRRCTLKWKVSKNYKQNNKCILENWKEEEKCDTNK